MTDRGKILEKAIDIINNDRNSQYGDPEDSFALIAEYWTVYLRNTLLQKAEGNLDVLFSEYLVSQDDVAMMMTLMKIAREHYQGKRDNVVDAAGYLGIYGDKYEVDETDFVDTNGCDDLRDDVEKSFKYGEMPDSDTDVMSRKEEQRWIEKAKQGIERIHDHLQQYNKQDFNHYYRVGTCDYCKKPMQRLKLHNGFNVCIECLQVLNNNE